MKNQIITIASVAALGLAKKLIGSRSVPSPIIYHPPVEIKLEPGMPQSLKIDSNIPGIETILMVAKPEDSRHASLMVVLTDDGPYSDFRNRYLTEHKLNNLFEPAHYADIPRGAAGLSGLVPPEKVFFADGKGIGLVRRELMRRTGVEPSFAKVYS